LNKTIQVSEGNLKAYPEAAGDAIAFMMQKNPLVAEVLEAMERLPQYSGRTSFTTLPGSLEEKIPVGQAQEDRRVKKADMIRQVGALITQELHKQTGTEVPKSLRTKIQAVIASFLDIINVKRLSRINSNIEKIASQVLAENQSLITASPFKPGKNYGKKVTQVSLEAALKKDVFGKEIINKLKDYFLLTGSTSLSEQGTVLIPKENPLHDIDWVSGYTTTESIEIFNKVYPDAKFVRSIVNEDFGYETNTFVIVPDGYKVENFSVGEGGKPVNYDITKDGNYVGKYLPKLDRHTSKVGGKLIDIFTGLNESKMDTPSFEAEADVDGGKINLASWRTIIKAKLEYARLKDIWDYNRWIPNEKRRQLDKLPEC